MPNPMKHLVNTEEVVVSSLTISGQYTLDTNDQRIVIRV